MAGDGLGDKMTKHQLFNLDDESHWRPLMINLTSPSKQLFHKHLQIQLFISQICLLSVLGK